MQNFSEGVMAALRAGVQEAQSRRHVEVSEEHLLAALLAEGGGYFYTILQEHGEIGIWIRLQQNKM